MNDYLILAENIMNETMGKDEYFDPKEYIWVLGKKVLASLVLESNVFLKTTEITDIMTLFGIEVHEGRDYGDEVIMLLRDVTKRDKPYRAL